MNWEAIGAIGEILGALAVVLTLGYLAVQVKYAKTATTDATRLNRANGVQAMLLAVATDDVLRETVIKAQGTSESVDELVKQLGLSANEAARMDMYASYWFWLHWGQFASSNSDEGVMELRNVVNTFYRFPYMTICWRFGSSREILDPTFVSFVDAILDEPAS
ncbi:MAG TPA: hypothetical protein VIS76_05700 [Pseudomonadales bacterium]